MVGPSILTLSQGACILPNLLLPFYFYPFLITFFETLYFYEVKSEENQDIHVKIIIS